MLLTYTGKLVDPFNIKKEDISMLDIAESLSKTCRFNGHCKGFYSVAQHSVLLSDKMHDSTGAKFGLLHDAAEAYIGDIVTPFKKKLKGIDKIESDILNAIFNEFHIKPTAQKEKEVQIIDARLLVTEMEQLCGQRPPLIDDSIRSYEIRIEPWSWEKAHREFMKRALQLWQA